MQLVPLEKAVLAAVGELDNNATTATVSEVVRSQTGWTISPPVVDAAVQALMVRRLIRSGAATPRALTDVLTPAGLEALG